MSLTLSKQTLLFQIGFNDPRVLADPSGVSPSAMQTP